MIVGQFFPDTFIFKYKKLLFIKVWVRYRAQIRLVVIVISGRIIFVQRKNRSGRGRRRLWL